MRNILIYGNFKKKMCFVTKKDDRIIQRCDKFLENLNYLNKNCFADSCLTNKISSNILEKLDN